MTMSPELLTRMIKAGAGEVPADVVIKNVRLLDVISGSVTHTDIAVSYTHLDVYKRQQPGRVLRGSDG